MAVEVIDVQTARTVASARSQFPRTGTVQVWWDNKIETYVPPVGTPDTPSTTPTTEPTPRSSNNPVTTTEPAKCKWAIQAFNASDPNDVNQIIVNGSQLIALPDNTGLLQDSDWIDISDSLVGGDGNVVRFAAYSTDKTATWGFRIRRGSEVVVEAKGSSSTGGGGVFDESYSLTANCGYKKLQPSGDEWIVQGEYDQWGGGLFLFDGVPIRGFGGKDPRGTYSFDISKWILAGSSHEFEINPKDFATGNGSTNFVLRIQKNKQVIFSKDFFENRGTFQPLSVYISPDGRLSLTPP